MEIEIFLEDNKKINAKVRSHLIKTDQPVGDGGDDSAATPFDLFLSSIGTCVGYYIKSFCLGRNISSEGIKIIQKSEYDRETHLVTDINIEVELPPDFPEKYKEAVLASASKCKVKRHLENPPNISVKSILK